MALELGRWGSKLGLLFLAPGRNWKGWDLVHWVQVHDGCVRSRFDLRMGRAGSRQSKTDGNGNGNGCGSG
ncbi:hypothetical protein H9L39_10359 [Fusarium oxysporum f. sp. albedinis]|nr:hypothetical protein H9L39_10359 [Fusarium oxysporum f. sp. albedinis]